MTISWQQNVTLYQQENVRFVNPGFLAGDTVVVRTPCPIKFPLTYALSLLSS